MTLAERAKRLQDTLSTVSWLKKEEEAAKLHRARREQLVELRQRITEARRKLEVLRTHAHAAAEPAVSADLAERLMECRTALAQSSRIENSTWTPLTRSLQGLATRHENLVKAAIKQQHDAVSTVDTKSVTAMAEALGRLQELLDIQRERTSLVSTEWETKGVEELAQLLQRAAKLLDRWEKISFEDIPPAVERFLEAARRGGAPYDRFNDEVRAWLEKNGLLSRVRISLARE